MSKERFSRGKSMDDTDVPSGRGQDRPRPSDLFDVYPIPEKWGKVRFFGPIFKTGGHWVKTKNKDGKPTSFYAPCTAFDSEEGKRDSTKKCPWCAHKGEEGEVRFASDFWSNAIIRALQKNRPSDISKPTKVEASTGFKDKDSETWTPVRAVRLTPNNLKGLKDLKQLNVTEGEDGETVGYAVSHPKYGCDVMLKQDPKATPANRYQIQKGEMKALSKEEKAYLIWDLSELPDPPSFEESKSEYDKWYERMHKGKKPKADEGDDDEDDTPKKGKRKVVDEDEDDEDLPKSKAKRKVVDEDDDDDDDLPPKSKKSSSKSKSRDDDDEDDDDEDDEPPKKKGKAKPSRDEDDEDEDDDDDFDDDDEDEKPKSKKKPAAKKSSRDDDDDEDEDDDEDDEPPKKSAKGKAKSKVVDDDDDEDEDDEEDEPPRKKASAKKPAAKKRSRDEDEDDDDI